MDAQKHVAAAARRIRSRLAVPPSRFARAGAARKERSRYYAPPEAAAPGTDPSAEMLRRQFEAWG
jgi:hypothetical protein